MNQKNLFNLVATAIILKDPYKKGIASEYLIMKRSDKEKTFPGKWTVPGGKLSTDDYTNLPRETEHYWYNVIGKALRREVKEEANIEIKNVWYITSLARVIDRGYGSLISYVADYAGGEIKINDDMQDFTWVTYKKAKEYDLLDGIMDELHMTERILAGEKDVEWERAK